MTSSGRFLPGLLRRVFVAEEDASSLALGSGEPATCGAEEHPDDRRDHREQRRDAAERDLRVRPGDGVRDEESGAVDGAAHDASVRPAPAVAMLEPGEET